MYWPGIKATIENVIKECEICEMNKRKRKNSPTYVQTNRPLEKVAIDVMYLNEENRYLLVGVDYFTRFMALESLEKKDMYGVRNALEKWFAKGHIPEQLISDNGKEFVNVQMKKMCKKYGIEHVTISVD